MNQVMNILGALVVVAGITTVVVNAGGSAQVLTAFGNAFKGSLMAAQGHG
jgi:hypothetical protein